MFLKRLFFNTLSFRIKSGSNQIENNSGKTLQNIANISNLSYFQLFSSEERVQYFDGNLFHLLNIYRKYIERFFPANFYLITNTKGDDYYFSIIAKKLNLFIQN